MTALMFQILKMNVAAAVMISVAIGIGHFTKERYSSKWKYCMWLIIMVFLLVPIDFSGKSLVKIQVVMLGVILVGTQAFVGVSFEAVQAAAGGLVEFQPDRNGENENTDAADGNTDSNGGGSSDTESAETRGITLTDEQKTVWATDGSWANYIYRATDGNWYDGSGRLYYENGGGSWTQASSGEAATEDAPETPSEEAISSVNVTDDSGYNSQTLYESGSGEWMNNASGVYTDNGDGTFTGPDGTLWYEN